jgi:hypothetical protein
MGIKLILQKSKKNGREIGCGIKFFHVKVHKNTAIALRLVII